MKGYEGMGVALAVGDMIDVTQSRSTYRFLEGNTSRSII